MDSLSITDIDNDLKVLIKLKYPNGFGFDPHTLEDLLIILKDLSVIDKIDFGHSNRLISFYVNPVVFELLLPSFMVKSNKNTCYYEDFVFRNSPHIYYMADVCYKLFEDQISRPYHTTMHTLRTVVIRDRRLLDANPI